MSRSSFPVSGSKGPDSFLSCAQMQERPLFWICQGQLFSVLPLLHTAQRKGLRASAYNYYIIKVAHFLLNNYNRRCFYCALPVIPLIKSILPIMPSIFFPSTTGIRWTFFFRHYGGDVLHRRAFSNSYDLFCIDVIHCNRCHSFNLFFYPAGAFKHDK